MVMARKRGAQRHDLMILEKRAARESQLSCAQQLLYLATAFLLGDGFCGWGGVIKVMRASRRD